MTAKKYPVAPKVWAAGVVSAVITGLVALVDALQAGGTLTGLPGWAQVLLAVLAGGLLPGGAAYRTPHQHRGALPEHDVPPGDRPL